MKTASAVARLEKAGHEVVAEDGGKHVSKWNGRVLSFVDDGGEADMFYVRRAGNPDGMFWSNLKRATVHGMGGI